MKRSLLYGLVLICCALRTFSEIPHADPPHLIFRNITNNDGLSNSSITCIFQDSTGLMWFGSWDGLNVYNGRTFEVYKPDLSNPSSISNNIIRDIIEERKNRLWIATDQGINLFDAITRTFQRFFFDSAMRTTHRERSYLLAKNRSNMIFCAVYELGLSYYTPDKNEFIPLQIPGVNTFHVRSMLFDHDDNLWILQEKGELYKVRLQVDKKGRVQVKDARKIEMAHPLWSMHYSGGATIWLAGKNMVYSLQIDSARPTAYRVSGNTGLIQEDIAGIVHYAGRLWIGYASAGLYQCSIDTLHRSIICEQKPFASRGVFSLFKGSQDILWVGTDGQGIYKIYDNHKKFINYSSKQIPVLGNNPVRSFCEASPGVLYVGTKGGGLLRIPTTHANGEKVQESIQVIDTRSGLNSNAVFSLYKGNNDRLWIGTDGLGIQVLDLNTGKIDLIAPHASSTKGAAEFGSVYAIGQTPDSAIWLGTSGYGLIRMQIVATKGGYRISEYKRYSFDKDKSSWLGSNIIYAIYPQGDSILWIGTRGGGLNRFNYVTEKFSAFKAAGGLNTLSSNDILCITGDKKNGLWIGTSNGFSHLSTTRDGAFIFKNFSEKDGLPNNTVHGIIGDSNGQLWISTNNGISKFDPATGVFLNYTKGDGLQNNEFSDGAYYISPSNGMIYFGGIKGFNAFFPGDINNSSYRPRIHLSNFKLYNSEEPLYRFTAGGGREWEKGIELKYDQNFFSVDFVALDFINNEKCEYSYLLENFHKDWVNSGSSRTAVFTNVPPGHYTLKIKCTNGDMVWNNEVFSLPIHIKLPWWKTFPAYLGYVVLLLALAYGVYWLVKMRLQFVHSLLVERMNRKREEDIHEAKLRFFTNIAHEFCTPLTLIYGPCEKLLGYEFSDQFERKYLKIIKANAERMLSLIQQLMDFRKTETGHFRILAEDIDISEMIRYIADSFSEMAERNRLSFHVQIAPEVQWWRSDRNSLEKILYNLLSNAFKYTQTGGTVSVTMAIENDRLHIQVSNTGKGIRKEEIGELFNRFKILDNFEARLSGGPNVRTGLGLLLTKTLVTQLNGDLLVESEENGITSFEVTLPQLGTAWPDIAMREETDSVDKEAAKALPEEAGIGTEYIQEDIGNLRIDEEGLMEKASEGPDKQVILVVEDEKDIRHFLFDTLCEEYSVIQAEGGKSALEKLKQKLPDLIICDVLMPGMTGIELTREIKTNLLTRHIPVILLTGKRTVEDQISGISVGADFYLPKPFYPRHLKAIIGRLLENRQTLKTYYNSSVANMDYYNGSVVGGEDQQFIVKVTALIEQNLDQDGLNPAYISSELGISRMQLYRKIKELAGQSPSEFIRTLRMKFAARQIITTAKTIQEIMYESGFNNKAYFFREFGKMFKMSPGEYRNKHQQTF